MHKNDHIISIPEKRHFSAKLAKNAENGEHM
jgi:hypothetical protein